jgi:hypothetical protein
LLLLLRKRLLQALLLLLLLLEHLLRCLAFALYYIYVSVSTAIFAAVFSYLYYLLV